VTARAASASLPVVLRLCSCTEIQTVQRLLEACFFREASSRALVLFSESETDIRSFSKPLSLKPSPARHGLSLRDHSNAASTGGHRSCILSR
jgi:hypothetical protein